MSSNIEELWKKISTLEKRIAKLRLALEDNGIDEPDRKFSDTEIICMVQLDRLKQNCAAYKYDKDEATVLEKLQKILAIERGIIINEKKGRKKEKKKDYSEDELMKIINGGQG